MPKALKNIVDEVVIPEEPVKGEDFNEDVHNERIVKKISGKMSVNSWFKSLFFRPDEPFNPVLLSDEEYTKKAKKCLEESWELLNQPGWSKAKSGPEEGDLVEVLNHNIHGKIFRLTGYMECPAEFLYKEFTENVEDMPKWNPAILDSKLVKVINENVDITYQVTAGGGGGAVKPRDFVNLRIKGQIGGHYLSCGVSIDYPGFPPTSNFIRGQNNIGCWAMQEINGENGIVKCRFQWLMGCNLKGWIPQYVLDVAFTTAMLEFLDHLRAFIAKKKSEGVL